MCGAKKSRVTKATISYNGLMERLKKKGVWRGRE